MHSKIVVFFLFSLGVLFAQVPKYDKTYLQKQNAKLKKEIRDLNKELQENRKISKNSVAYVQSLNKKIERQSKLVNNINVEKRFIDDEIYKYSKEINVLNKELNTLKENYKKVLVRAYKNKSTSSRLLFILSSESIGQAYRRIKYLEKYSEYQQEKVNEITAKQTEVKAKIEQRKKARQEKNELLASQIVFQEELEQEKREKEQVVARFEKDRNKIIAQLKQKRNNQKKNDAEIQKIIEEEIRLAKIREEEERKKREAEEAERKKQLEIAKQKALEEERKRQEALEKERKEQEKIRLAKLEADRKEQRRKELEEARKIEDAKERERLKEIARKKAEDEKKRIAAEAKAREEAAEKKRKEAEAAAVKKVEESQPKFASRATSAELSANFVSNKGKLPWPVTHGTVVGQFGVNSHAVLKGIKVENSGVEIATKRNSTANAVFEGTVSAVSIIKGGNRTVLVKHGNYFTLYHNLSRVFVSKGDKIKRGQKLGQIYTDSNGETILTFQVWKGTKKENPANWISGM